MSRAPTDKRSDGSFLGPLASLLRAIAAADSADAVLAETMAFLRESRPRLGRLISLHADARGQLHLGRLLAEWQNGTVELGDAAAHPITDFPLVAAWQGRLSEPVFLGDIAVEPGISEPLRQHVLAAGFHAAVLIPLFIESYGGWQGVLKIYWSEPHRFSPEEQDLYGILMTALSTHLGGLASQSRLGATLQDLDYLQQLGRKLNVAHTFDEALKVLALPAPAPDDAELVLCAIESDDRGNPTWLQVISALSPPGRSATNQVGARYHIPDIPFAALYLGSPDRPMLISDIATDPRVDENARAIYARIGIRSTIIIPLTIENRWVGLLNVIWQRPVELGEREQHIYEALAKHTALRLDHTMIVDRLRASLAEMREQGAVLRLVLDNIPVGILFSEAASGRVLLSNRAAANLIGRPLDASVVRDEYSQVYRSLRPGTDQPFPAEELPSHKATHTGQVQTDEIDVLAADGTRRSLEITAVPMADGTGLTKNVVVVVSDLTLRKRAEAERLRLQEAALQAQAAALAERSSPLIPITDEILVLPIIGSIDTERGQQILDAVLSGASRRRARVAIIDITGVRTVDTQAAAALTAAAQALRLLGVLPILTGIKAEVAQTLVGLGIDLDGIITRSTLQSGIQDALRQLRKPGLG